MKPKFNSFRRTSLPLAMLALAFSQSAIAEIATWVGTTSTWNTVENWSGTNTPPISGDSLVFGAAGAGGTTLTDDLMTPGFNIAGITFDAGASAFVINPATAGTNGFNLTGNITNNSSSLQTINDKIYVNSNRTITTSTGGGDITLGGGVTNGPLIASGSGNLTLSGNLDNAFLQLNAQGGTVSLAKTAGNAVAGISGISSGAKVVLVNSNQIYGGGSSYGVHGLEGTLDMNGKTESVSSLDGTAGTVDNSAAGTAALTVGESNVTTAFGGNITNTGGALSLAKTGTGTMTLSGSNSYTGTTTVSGGTLAISGSGTLGAATANLSMTGGKLDLGTTSKTVGAVTITAAGSGDTIQNGTLTASSFGASLTSGTATLSASLAGTGATMTMSGGFGTLLLTGNNSYTGNISVTNGALILAGDNSSAGTMSITGFGKLQIGNGGTSGTLASGNVSGGALHFNRTDLVSAPYVVNNTILNSTITVNSGAVQLDGSADNGFAKVIIKDGATLIAAKSVGGGVHAFGSASTVESGGTLKIGGNNTGAQVYFGTTVTVNSGGVIDLNGNSENFGLNIAGTGISNGGALINSSTSAGSSFNHALTLTGDTSMGGAGDLTIAGEISGSYGLTKDGAGTLTLSNTNTYTGDTTVSAGTLALTGGSETSPITVNGGAFIAFSPETPIASSSNLTLNSGAKVKITELPGAGSYTLFATSGSINGTPVLDTTVSGYILSLTVDGGNTLILNAEAASGYNSWNGDNAGGQAPELDWDNDGVANGVEYFMNAAAGFTATPALGAGNTITWPNGGNIPNSDYGTQYVVQTSGDLETWIDVDAGDLTTNTSGPGGSLTYTLTGSGKRFVRLKVTPTP